MPISGSIWILPFLMYQGAFIMFFEILFWTLYVICVLFSRHNPSVCILFWMDSLDSCPRGQHILNFNQIFELFFNKCCPPKFIVKSEAPIVCSIFVQSLNIFYSNWDMLFLFIGELIINGLGFGHFESLPLGLLVGTIYALVNSVLLLRDYSLPWEITCHQ